MRSVETVRRLAGVVLGIGVALGAGTGWAKEGVEPPSRHEVRKALHAVIDAGLPAVGLVITSECALAKHQRFMRSSRSDVEPSTLAAEEIPPHE